MKPIFGTDLTKRGSKKNNCDLFLARTVDEALSEEYDQVCELVINESEQRSDATYEKSRKRLRLKSGKTTLALLAIAAVLALILFLVGGDAALGKHIRLVAPLALIIYALFLVARHRLIKDNDEDEEGEQDESIERLFDDPRIKEAEARMNASIGVPETAPTVDILFFDYKMAAGEIRRKDRSFTNLDMRIFVDADALCLSDTERRFDIPLADIRSLKTVKGDFSLSFWNKSVPCDAGEYRFYGIKKKHSFRYTFSTYHVLEVEREGERYGLYFPCYELPTLQELIGSVSE